MLRVNEIRHVDAMCGSGGEVAVRSHAPAHIRAYGALAVVIVGCFFGTSALAQAPVPAVTTKHAATAPATSSSKHPNLAKKAVLCERAEALADSTNWLQTAEAIKGLQAEWKTIGPVTRGQEKAVWERFRGACDRFECITNQGAPQDWDKRLCRRCPTHA